MLGFIQYGSRLFGIDASSDPGKSQNEWPSKSRDRTLGRGTLGRGTLGRERKTRVDYRSGDLHRVDSRSGAS